jgi:membrane carboxypeptidase/penicillin-binding protein
LASVAQIVRRRKRRRLHKRQESNRQRLWTLLVVAFVLLITAGPAGVVISNVVVAYDNAFSLLPDDPKQAIYLEPVTRATEIYDSSGQILLFVVQDPLGDERAWITSDQMPEHLIDATLLWEEDEDFLESAHFGILETIFRLLENLNSGPLEAEQSISRRLARNAILSRMSCITIADCATEIALVAEINRRYTAQEVLEWHLNTNDYGNGAYGIEAAAQMYFGKTAQDLTLDEVAMLATIPTEPKYNPVDDETAARGRQSNILRRMLAAGYITQSQFEEVINTHTDIRPDAGQKPLLAAEFSVYARKQTETILNSLGLDGQQLIARGGLRVTTTLDIDLYLQSECMLRTHLGNLTGSIDTVTDLNGNSCFGAVYLPPTGAVENTAPNSGEIVIINAQSGEIMAIVGRSTVDSFQPGTMLHPFVYLSGFINADPNYTPASMLFDVRQPFPGAADGLLYIPNNPDEIFRGPLSLRDAMGANLLPPVTQVANVLNLNDVIRNIIHLMGVNGLNEGIYDLSLLEHGGRVSVLDMTYAYSVFSSLGDVNGFPVEANSPGFRTHDPVAVKRIEDANGNLIWAYDEQQILLGRINILQAEAAYLVNDILSDPNPRRITLGESTVLETSRPAAVINGLTSDHVDNWTIGYTPSIVTGVHLGRANGGSMSLEGYGIEGAAPLWQAITDYIHDRDNLPADGWQRPAMIAETDVCLISGMSPNGACQTRSEIFLNSNQFPAEDTYWQQIEINTQTNLLATANTPTALRNMSAYFIPPQEAEDWWRDNNHPLPPTQYDTISRPDIVSSAVILQPENLATIGGVFDVRGSMDNNNMNYYQLAYGSGPNPSEWIDITGVQETFNPGTSLGMWDTATLDGTYVLRLGVGMEDGTLETYTVQIFVDNIPPSIILTAGDTGQIFQLPDDDIIPLVAIVADNNGTDRVEFYHNGLFVGVDEEYPFGYEHTINRAGTEVFTAKVFDAVGNYSEVDITVEVVRSSS